MVVSLLMEKMPYSHEVNQGIMFLNSKKKDWSDYVHLPHLDMTTAEDCILGLVFGEEAFDAEFGSGFTYAHWKFKISTYDVIEMGFDLEDWNLVNYGELRRTWTHVIERHRIKNQHSGYVS